MWSVARKAGFSPESGNFITNQAIPVGEYINDWVSRLWAQEDWPEWSITARFAPTVGTGVEHIVNWIQPPIDFIRSPVLGLDIPDAPAPGSYVPYIGRVLNVYLNDPRTSLFPVPAKFTLNHLGIHCGFEHGSSVWIKYLPIAPEFTAVKWRVDFTYSKGQTVYSPFTGECYKSLVNNNLGHDPALNQLPAPDLTIEEIQSLVQGGAGIPTQSQIVDCFVATAQEFSSLPDPIPVGDSFTLNLHDTAGALIATHTVTQAGTSTTEDLLNALKTAFDGDALAGFTFTVTAPDKFTITSTTTPFAIFRWIYVRADTTTFPLVFVQTQPFSAGVAPSDIVPKILKVMIGDNAFIPGALYSVTITELDGSEHVVTYQSDVFDNRTQILNGLLLAIGASTDATLSSIGVSLDTVAPAAFLSLIRELGVNVQVTPPASQFWLLVPFPASLFNAVVRGASAQLMGEWGQTDKMTIEEQKVPGEEINSRGDFEATTIAPLTTQQKPVSRYKIAP